MSVASFAAGTQVRSPQELAAGVAAPPRSTLTAEVRRGTLGADATIAGTVRPGKSATIRYVAGTTEATPVLTDQPLRPGATVQAGTRIADISDRPLFVLRGRIPMIRELRSGDQGADVARLQDGLADAGYPVYDTSGYFGGGTVQALDALYEASGQDLPASGASVGPNDIAFVPGLPATFDRYAVGLGAEVGDNVATVHTTGPLVVAGVPEELLPLFRLATPVQFSLAGRTVRGRVIGSTTIEDPTKGFTIRVTIAPNASLDERSIDRQVTIRSSAVEGRNDIGLLVPVSALYGEADGSIYVQQLDGDGNTEAVRVTVRESRDGEARIDVADGASLAPGNEVVIGVGD